METLLSRTQVWQKKIVDDLGGSMESNRSGRGSAAEKKKLLWISITGKCLKMSLYSKGQVDFAKEGKDCGVRNIYQTVKMEYGNT
jgi:hypothetical protein